MGNAIHQMRAYVADMRNATQRTLALVAAQLRSAEIQALPETRGLLERLVRTLGTHVDDLTEHLRRLGGESALVELRSDERAPEPVAKALRDYYAALSLAHAGALMLESNARALGFSSTAALAGRHREETATLLARIREALPAAVA